MIDPNLVHLWIMRALFVLLSLAILFFHLLPLNPTPSRWAGPDLLVAVTFAMSRLDFLHDPFSGGFVSISPRAVSFLCAVSLFSHHCA